MKPNLIDPALYRIVPVCQNMPFFPAGTNIHDGQAGSDSLIRHEGCI